MWIKDLRDFLRTVNIKSYLKLKPTPMHILIVEPDTNNATFLQQNLKAACYSVDVCTNYANASFQARTTEFDLIICEYKLPDGFATTLCEELRKKQKHTPMIIMSSLTDFMTRIKCLDAGADDFILKPFFFEELLAHVRAILRRPKSITKSVMRIDDLELDAVKHKVFRGNDDIYLTRKEFELLEYLMKNEGAVLTRGQILEHVWDIHADIFSNTIETHILNLRRKVDFIPHRKLIHTIPGRGYKIENAAATALERVRILKNAFSGA